MRASSMIESLESRTFLSASPSAGSVDPQPGDHSAVHASMEHDSAGDDQSGHDNTSASDSSEDDSGATGSLTTAAGPTLHASRVAHGGPTHHPVQRLHLHGSVTGSFTTSVADSSTGKAYRFTGSGTVRPLGAASLAGQLTTPGGVATGRATGQLTISGPNGSITLDVTGPKESRSRPLPARLSFTVASGTGSYSTLKGGGHLTIKLDSTAQTFTIKFD